MDFSSLVKAVQDFWNFVWPPVICLALLYWISAYIAPSSLQGAWARFVAIHPPVGTQFTVWKAVKRFGFDKLIPYLAAFALIFALDATRNIIVIVGAITPPNISYDPDKLMIQHGESFELRTLWYRLGKIDDLMEFRQAIDRTVSEAKETHKDSPVLRDIDHWRSKSAEAYAAFSASRFFVLFAAVLGMVEMVRTKRVWRTGLRTALCMGVFCVASLIFCMRFVYSVEQEFYSRSQAAEVFAPKTPTCVLSESNLCPEYEDFLKMNRWRHSRGRWWFVAGSDGWYFRWLFEQAKGPSY